MAARSPVDVIQRDFSGGEISTRMLMRDDTVVYQKSAVAMRNFLPTMTGSVERTRGTRFLRQIEDLNCRIIPYRTLDNKKNLVVITPGKLQMVTGEAVELIEGAGSSTYSATQVFYRKPIVTNGDFSTGQDPWTTTTPKYKSNNGDGPLGTWWAPLSGRGGIMNLMPRLYNVKGDKVTVDIQSPVAVVDVATDVLTVYYRIQHTTAVPFYSGYEFTIRIETDTGALVKETKLDYQGVGYIWDVRENVPLPSPNWTGSLVVKISVTAQAYRQGDIVEKWSTPRFFLEEFQLYANGVTDIVETDTVVPYTAGELRDIHYVQSPYDPKELVLVHPKHPPARYYFDSTTGAYVYEPIPFLNQPIGWTVDNYPSTCTSYLGRLVLAGGQDRVIGSPIAANSETVWATKVARWDEFSADDEVNPDDSIELTTIYRSPIQWAHGHKNLLVGAQEMEYIVSADGIFAPNDLGVAVHSTHGGAHVQPAGFGEGVLFAADSGQRVRSMSYDNQQQGWVAADMTVYHPNLCSPGIRRMVRMRNPHQMCLVLLNSGELVIFHQEAAVMGWSRMDLTGGTIQDICVMTDDQGIDIPYMTVRRNIDGEVRLYLEAIATWTTSSSWDYLYCSRVDNDKAARPEPWIIPNLEYLEGQTVQVVADGSYLGNYEVVGGQVVLETDIGTKISPVVAYVGLPMFSTLITLPPSKVDPGSPSRYAQFSVRCLGSTRPIINGQRPAERDPGAAMGRTQPLDWWGDYEVMTDSWDPYQMIAVEENVPLRCEILGVYGKLASNSI